MTTKTKWFENNFAGAPTLTGQAGSLIGVLDAVLINGFNSVTLDSLVVSGNIATATKASHGFKRYQIVEIEGASPAGLNGQWRVLTITTDTFTFATTGITDQTATGTITCKTPGAGWTKSFSGTNVAIYKSQSPLAVGSHAVRVTDTGTTSATCLAAENWTDINTPVNSIGTFYINKSAWADDTERNWNVIVDDRTIYIAISKTGAAREVCTWGDFKSLAAGDSSAFHIRAPSAANAATLGYRTSLGYVGFANPGSDVAGITARDYSQVVGPVPNRIISAIAAFHTSILDITTAFYTDGAGQVKTFALSGGSFGSSQSGTSITYSSYGLQAANPVDGGIHFTQVFLHENCPSVSARIRGVVRGLLHIFESFPLNADVVILPGLAGVDSGLVMGFRTVNECNAFNAGSRMYPQTHFAISLGEWD